MADNSLEYNACHNRYNQSKLNGSLDTLPTLTANTSSQGIASRYQMQLTPLECNSTFSNLVYESSPGLCRLRNRIPPMNTTADPSLFHPSPTLKGKSAHKQANPSGAYYKLHNTLVENGILSQNPQLQASPGLPAQGKGTFIVKQSKHKKSSTQHKQSPLLQPKQSVGSPETRPKQQQQQVPSGQNTAVRFKTVNLKGGAHLFTLKKPDRKNFQNSPFKVTLNKFTTSLNTSEQGEEDQLTEFKPHSGPLSDQKVYNVPTYHSAELPEFVLTSAPNPTPTLARCASLPKAISTLPNQLPSEQNSPIKISKGSATKAVVAKAEPIQLRWEGIDLPSVDITCEFNLDKLIGRGNSSDVYKAIDLRLGKTVALKVIEKKGLSEDHMKEMAQQEIDICVQLDHPKLAKVYRVMQSDTHIYMSMKYCGNTTLSTLSSRTLLGPRRAKRLFRQIAEGVAYMHNKGFAHRDLKFSNIMVDDLDQIKIIDYGFACKAFSLESILCGTPAYMCPELVREEDYRGSEADIWSLGVILYRFLMGSYPFGHCTDEELEARIIACKPDYPPELDPSAKDLLQAMLCPVASQRIRAQQILEHPWFISK